MFIDHDDFGTRIYPFIDEEPKGFEAYVYVSQFDDEVRPNIQFETIRPERWSRFKEAVDYAFGFVLRRRLLVQAYAAEGRKMTYREAEELLTKLDTPPPPQSPQET